MHTANRSVAEWNYFIAGLDVDVSSRTGNTTDDESSDATTDERPDRTANSNTAHITDNIIITQPVYVDQQ